MYRKLGLFLCSVLLSCIYTTAYAQLNNNFFRIDKPDTTKGIVRLQIENLNYLRNLEYKSQIDEGRTLFGYQIAPEINYQIDKNIQVSVGLFAQKDFWAKGYYALKPMYSLQYKTGAKTFRFGNILGSVQHNLIEPLYDPERVIENRLENGIQCIWNKKHFYFDSWLDWQKMIYQNSNYPEAFTAGIYAEPKWVIKEQVQFSTPVSVLVFHQGGEIDTSHQRTLSSFNFDYAGKVIIKPKRGFDSMDFQIHLAYYEDISTPPTSFIDGLGQLASAAAYFNHFGVMLNYWDAHQFQGLSGDVIYQSISFKNRSLYSSDYRKMAMMRIFYQKQLSTNLKFLFRTNFIYDLHKHTQDFIAELYFRWTPTFVLGKIKG